MMVTVADVAPAPNKSTFWSEAPSFDNKRVHNHKRVLYYVYITFKIDDNGNKMKV
jgi:hypothetical protein